jgi:predicted deacylase
LAASLVTTDIDFERDGRQISTLRLPYSSNLSAYGVIPLPIAVLKNGTGPTALLMGGNHGDEYEGPVALGKLIREFDLRALRGRLIILPAANYPAVMAGLRNSPIDGLNLNRSFPGDRNGSPTQQIAHYIAEILMPMADAVVDLHSGGATLDFVHCANIYRLDHGALRDRTLALAEAFGAPLTVMFDDRGEERTILATAKRLKIPALTTELGGGASLSIEGLRLCSVAVLRVLRFMGLVEDDPPSFAGQTRFVEISNETSYVYAPCTGLFEPADQLGVEVRAGTPAGWVHFLGDPGRKPVEVPYRQSGLLCMKRPPAQVAAGDCLTLVVTDLADRQAI